MARRVDLVLVLAAVALLVFALARCGHRVPALPPQRASWTLTPGVANPDVTSATTAITICKSGWTRTIRPPVSYTNDLKRKQMREYDMHFTAQHQDVAKPHEVSMSSERARWWLLCR